MCSVLVVLVIVGTYAVSAFPSKNTITPEATKTPALLWPKASLPESYRAARCRWQAVTNVTTSNSNGQDENEEIYSFAEAVTECFANTLKVDKWAQHTPAVTPHLEPAPTRHFYLVCERGALQSLKEIKRILPEFLRNKTVAFIGDSIHLQQIVAMACMLQASTPNALLVLPPFKANMRIRRYETFLNATQTTFRIAKLGPLLHSIHLYPAALQYELDKSSSHADWLVMNHGVHWNDNHHLQKHEGNDSLESLAEMTRDTFHAALRTHTSKDMPTVIWRESTLQNEPTSNGWWGGVRKRGAGCVIVNETMMRADTQSPGRHPANFRNDVVRGYFEPTASLKPSSRILYNTVFDAFLDAQHVFFIHNNRGDCVHLGIDALIFLNQAWLSMVME